MWQDSGPNPDRLSLNPSGLVLDQGWALESAQIRFLQRRQEVAGCTRVLCPPFDLRLHLLAGCWAGGACAHRSALLRCGLGFCSPLRGKWAEWAQLVTVIWIALSSLQNTLISIVSFDHCNKSVMPIVIFDVECRDIMWLVQVPGLANPRVQTSTGSLYSRYVPSLKKYLTLHS